MMAKNHLVILIILLSFIYIYSAELKENIKDKKHSFSRKKLLNITHPSITDQHQDINSCEKCKKDEEKRNVILIIADDMGIEFLKIYEDQMGGLGRKTYPKTPNIDALAATGVKFNKAYSYPICTATRATMLTGRYGFRNDLSYQVGPKCPLGLKYPQPTIPHSLSPNVSTACIGKWHMDDWIPGNIAGVINSGFDYYEGLYQGATQNYFNWNKTKITGEVEVCKEYITSYLTNTAIHWIKENQHNQFFLWLAHVAPHSPFHKPPVQQHNFPDLEPNMRKVDMSNPKVLLDYACAMIESLDFEVGRLLQNIDPEILKKTTIIFLGDNGSDKALSDGFPFTRKKAKMSVYEGGIRVPFIVSGAGICDGGRDTDELVHTADIYATVLDIMEGEKNTYQQIDSYSIVEIMKDKEGKTKRDFLISEMLGPNGTNCDYPNFRVPTFMNYGVSIIDDKYKLLIPKTSINDTYYEDEEHELYRLTDDPFERNNLLAHGLDKLNEVEYEIYEKLLTGYYSLIYAE